MNFKRWLLQGSEHRRMLRLPLQTLKRQNYRTSQRPGANCLSSLRTPPAYLLGARMDSERVRQPCAFVVQVAAESILRSTAYRSIRLKTRLFSGRIWTLTAHWWVVYKFKEASEHRPMATERLAVLSLWQRQRPTIVLRQRWVARSERTIHITRAWVSQRDCSVIIWFSMVLTTKQLPMGISMVRQAGRVPTTVAWHTWAITSR